MTVLGVLSVVARKQEAWWTRWVAVAAFGLAVLSLAWQAWTRHVERPHAKVEVSRTRVHLYVMGDEWTEVVRVTVRSLGRTPIEVEKVGVELPGHLDVIPSLAGDEEPRRTIQGQHSADFDIALNTYAGILVEAGLDEAQLWVQLATGERVYAKKPTPAWPDDDE